MSATGHAIIIREALPEDEMAWRSLWVRHFEFHKVSLAPETVDSTWRRILDPSSTVSMLVALVGGELAGYAIYFAHPSTWIVGDDCYLEDIYTDERFRGLGAGRALMEELIALCRAKGWEHLYWHTDRDNEGARRLYDSFLAADTSVRYRMKLGPA